MTHIITPHPVDDQPPPEQFQIPKWVVPVVMLALSALVSYFTSQSKTDTAMARIEERENNHYGELKDAIKLLREELQRQWSIPR